MIHLHEEQFRVAKIISYLEINLFGKMVLRFNKIHRTILFLSAMHPAMKRFFLYVLLAIFITSCANQVAPTGGAKDVTPPKVVKESPHNLSTHFQSDKISITFDEFVVLNDPLSQVYFSPALESNPQYRLHGKTLTISKLGDLKPNTTYSVSFGEAVKD